MKPLLEQRLAFALQGFTAFLHREDKLAVARWLVGQGKRLEAEVLGASPVPPPDESTFTAVGYERRSKQP